MDNLQAEQTTDTINLNKVRKEFFDHTRVFNRESGDDVLQFFIKEDSEDFYNYIDWLGVSKDPKLIVLASNHHYYYDNNELREVRNIVHLRKLNSVRNLNEFINSVFRLLPAGACFIGCYSDTNLRGRQYRNFNQDIIGSLDPYDLGISSKSSFFRFLYNIFDQKTNRSITRKEVMLMLVDKKFRLLDMTELNGITYFCAQKDKSSSW